MRVLLFLLMLTLLPLQFSAAAPPHCCGHVAASQEAQTQHHQPIHLPVAQGTDDLVSNALGFDLDCGVCHANCAAAVMEMVETRDAPLASSEANTSMNPSCRSGKSNPTGPNGQPREARG